MSALRFHVALTITDLEAAVADYSRRLAAAPTVVVDGAYALWRTPAVNLSVRVGEPGDPVLRHLGFEDPEVAGFAVDEDHRGIAWERFSAAQQDDEIRSLWPDARFAPPAGG